MVTPPKDSSHHKDLINKKSAKKKTAFFFKRLQKKNEFHQIVAKNNRTFIKQSLKIRFLSNDEVKNAILVN